MQEKEGWGTDYKYTIEKQEVREHGTLINADTVNNNYYDNPFRYYCDQKSARYPEDTRLKKLIGVMQCIINQDVLKKRFGGDGYKYEELLEYCRCSNGKGDNEHFDDGYKSVITCIYEVASKFCVAADNETETALCIGNDDLKRFLKVEIGDAGLTLRYAKEIENFATYDKVKSEAESLVEELLPYIRCAAQYGNFFQFAGICLESDRDMPFITEPVKFKVSNEIIPNLIRPLYGDKPECGLREIIQNALDACKEYMAQSADSDGICVEVEVKTDGEGRKIIVRDYGIGMTRDILLTKYFVVGESSKKNSDTDVIGQFGIGALATFLLGEQIHVRTKNEQEGVVYAFGYTLRTQEYDNNNIDVRICKDADFTHGTEISVVLRAALSGQSESQLRKTLKLEEWYRLTGIPVRYRYEGKEIPLQSYEGEGYRWETLTHGQDGIEVKYCLECGKWQPHTNTAQIIYNGLMLPEPYKMSGEEYISFHPVIAIRCRSQAVGLNLERTKIVSGLEPILVSLKKRIIEYGKERLREDAANIIDAQGRIVRYGCYNKFLYNVPLFFYKKGFGIYSRTAVEKIKKRECIKGVMEIYGISGSVAVNINDLQEDRIYVFHEGNMDRMAVSDFIEEEDGTKYIAPDIMERYFVNGTDQYNGLRKLAMLKLYRGLGDGYVNESIKADAFWKVHNKCREQKEFEEEPLRARISHMVIGMGADEEFEAVIERYHPKLLCYKENISGYIYEDVDIGVIHPADRIH